MLSMIFLSDAERTQLIAQHRRERDKRICDRIKAVLLFDKGWSVAAITEALLLSEDAIREHINEYRESKKLKPGNGGSTQKLSIEQSNKLVAHLRSHTYLYVSEFEDFKLAVFGFFATLSILSADSVLGQNFRSRVRDKFHPINSSLVNT
jgi:transposase